MYKKNSIKKYRRLSTSKKTSKQKQIMTGGKPKSKIKRKYKQLKSTFKGKDGKTYNNLKKNYKKSKVGRLRRLTGRATTPELSKSGLAKAKMLVAKDDLKKKAINNYLEKKREKQKKAQLKVITSKFSKSPLEMLSKITDTGVKDDIKKAISSNGNISKVLEKIEPDKIKKLFNNSEKIKESTFSFLRSTKKGIKNRNKKISNLEEIQEREEKVNSIKKSIELIREAAEAEAKAAKAKPAEEAKARPPSRPPPRRPPAQAQAQAKAEAEAVAKAEAEAEAKAEAAAKAAAEAAAKAAEAKEAEEESEA